MDDTIMARFTAALSGPEAVVTEPATLSERGRDYWGFGGKPGVLLCPRTRDELVAVVRIAGQHHVPLVTRGGASNCAGAMMPNPDRALIDLSAMNRVLDIDPIARTARVQPGVINYALQQQLAPHGLCFSPDPVSAHLATVGGRHHRKRRRPTRAQVRRHLQPRRRNRSSPRRWHGDPPKRRR
jgi:glycolate oxidase